MRGHKQSCINFKNNMDFMVIFLPLLDSVQKRQPGNNGKGKQGFTAG